MPVMLDVGHPQACHAVMIDGLFPGQKFLDAERVALTGLLESDDTFTHCRNDFRLTFASRG